MEYTYPNAFGDAHLSMETEDKSLRPWDAADQYLLEIVKAEFGDASSILIINDTYGSLRIPLLLELKRVISYSDSISERESSRRNLALNNLKNPECTSLQDIDLTEVDLALIKIPKSLEYFNNQLKTLQPLLKEGCCVLAAGMSRYLPSSFFDCFNHFVEEGEYSRIQKKARYYKGIFKKKSDENSPEKPEAAFSFNGSRYITYPAVFSHAKLDPGSRFLLENLDKLLPDLKENSLIIDPGSGCGILGLEVLKRFDKTKLICTDDHYHAVLSSLANAKALGFEDRVQVEHCPVMDSCKENSADLIICNPPFHKGQKLSLETGFSFIRESGRVLKPGGTFLAVINKTLGYGNILQETFQTSIRYRENKKYTLIIARKNPE